MVWTEDKVATLRRMWDEGQSAAQIARAVGGVTRLAVIGKVNRLGLSEPKPKLDKPVGPVDVAPVAAPKPPRPPRADVRVAVVPYATSNSGVGGRACVSLKREPWGTP